MPKKLQAHGTGMGGHAVQHPARAGDQAVTALFLNAGQTTQKFVGDVFAQAGFSKTGTRNIQALGTQMGGAIGFVVLEFKAGHV